MIQLPFYKTCVPEHVRIVRCKFPRLGIFPEPLRRRNRTLFSARLCRTQHNSNLLRVSPTQSRATAEMDAARKYLRSQFAGGAVSLEKDATRGVAIITLDHPEKRNAVTSRMMVELYDHIAALETWEEGKACVLRGAGGNFSSGGDLDFAEASGTPEGSSAMNLWMSTTLNRLSALKMFSVCLLEGPTLGGGTEIALACDFLLAAPNVKFGVVHGKLGIVPAWGGGARLTHRVGHHRALELLLTSRILNAQECLEFGIADAVIPDAGRGGTLLDGAQQWMDKRLQHHHTVTRAMKQITMQAANLPMAQALEEERNIFLPFWGGELNKAALAKRVKHVSGGDN